MRVLTFLLLSLHFNVWGNFSIPPLRQPVTDQARLLNSQVKEILNLALINLHESAGSQIAVLTLPTIGQNSVEQIAIKIVDQWKLGDTRKDNGILVLLIADRKEVRIEVGQGVEGDLPDAIAKRIIDAEMIPYFQEGNYSQGILRGVYQIAKVANPRINIDSFFRMNTKGQHQVVEKKPFSAFQTIIGFLIFLILISTRSGRSILFLMLLSGRGGGGGRGRSGGFRGGGGGFSGGGASGRW
jgi:uncharacterized protein